MVTVFEDIHEDHFIRLNSVKSAQSLEDKIKEALDETLMLKHGEIVAIDEIPRVTPVFTTGDIILKKVPIITPSGDVICPELSIKVRVVNYLALEAPTPQNGQTHSSNLSADANELLGVFDYFVILALKGLKPSVH